MTTITEPDSLGLSYIIGDDGNIDIAGFSKPRKSKEDKLKEALEQKECRCFFAAKEINRTGQGRQPYTATEDNDLCCVNITVPNWDGLEITIDPIDKQEVEETLDGTVVYDIPAWRLWIGEDEIGKGMSLPAAIAAIHKWIVERDLDDETRLIFDTYQNA